MSNVILKQSMIAGRNNSETEQSAVHRLSVLCRPGCQTRFSSNFPESVRLDFRLAVPDKMPVKAASIASNSATTVSNQDNAECKRMEKVTSEVDYWGTPKIPRTGLEYG
jgi:hypothetical protein